jgi:hypothetical protein
VASPETTFAFVFKIVFLFVKAACANCRKLETHSKVLEKELKLPVPVISE